MALLNLDGLYADHDRRFYRNQVVYEKILLQCHRKIEHVNKKLKLFECYYQIPTYVTGFPLYPVPEARDYLQKKLTSNGLLAIPTSENTLYISWRPEDINRRQYKDSLDKIEGRDIVVNSSQVKVPPPVRVVTKGKGKGKPEPVSNVAMVRFNTLLDDMIPVNKDKIRITN